MAYSLNSETLVVTLDGVEYPPKVVNGQLEALSQEEAEWHRDARAAYAAASPTRTIENLRRARDEKLAETDWVVTRATESGGAVAAEWQTYRQALRDLPTNYSTSDSATLTESLNNLVWPTKPE